MAHIALYRTWRPQSFQDMVGQKHIVQTLQNSLREGRYSHAYLFSGPRGTGKTSAAKILAKAVNCLNGPGIEPCNQCEACVRITEGSVMDVLEIDAASNRGVDEIRDIRDKVKYAPTEVRKKVYIIDEVHMLTPEAFNALLKTLEEPPAHVMFILATTEPHKLPATIISRCQRFDFRRVSLEEQVERLKLVCREEQISIDDDALAFIGRLSDGGMRDALSLLDQIIAFSGQQVTYDDVLSITGGMASDQFEQLAIAIEQKDLGAALQSIDAMMQDGKSADKCMESLIYYFRDLLMIKMIPGSEAVTERILDVKRFATMAERFATGTVIAIIDTLNYYQTEMKYSAQPQTLFEVSIMKLCAQMDMSAGDIQPSSASSQSPNELVGQLINRIQKLEDQLGQLMKQGEAASSAGGGKSASMGLSSRAAAPSVSKRKTVDNLGAYLQGKEDPLFRTVVQQWNQVLGRVKESKITVHAWLVDGEPISVYNDHLLIAFKSAMHRDTTEKPVNKQLIEQVINEVYGHPYRLVTIMLKDWKDAADHVSSSESPKEELQLVLEDNPTSEGKGHEEWINEAIQLFGEDLVKIKEDE